MSYLLIALSFMALISVSMNLRRSYLRAMEIYREGIDALKRDEDFDDEMLSDYERLPDDSRSVYDYAIKNGALLLFAIIRVPIFVLLAYLLIQFIKLQW